MILPQHQQGVIEGQRAEIDRLKEIASKYREALLKCAPSHQGGHSDTGATIADCLGVPFPITVPDLEHLAQREGFDTDKLWPWLRKMRQARPA